MDLVKLQEYRECTDTSKKRRLLGALVAAEEALIVSCAKSMGRSGELADLMQAGRMGVLRAIEVFDSKRGSWKVYATQWIKHHMRRQVVDERDIIRKKCETRGMQLPKEVRDRDALGLPITAEQRARLAPKFLFVGLGGGGYSHTRPHVRSDGPEDRASSNFDDTSIPSALQTNNDDADVILTKAVLRAVTSLTPKEMRVFLSFVLEDEPSARVIAEREGMKREWARTTFAVALEKVRKALKVAVDHE